MSVPVPQLGSPAILGVRAAAAAQGVSMAELCRRSGLARGVFYKAVRHPGSVRPSTSARVDAACGWPQGTLAGLCGQDGSVAVGTSPLSVLLSAAAERSGASRNAVIAASGVSRSAWFAAMGGSRPIAPTLKLMAQALGVDVAQVAAAVDGARPRTQARVAQQGLGLTGEQVARSAGVTAETVSRFLGGEYVAAGAAARVGAVLGMSHGDSVRGRTSPRAAVGLTGELAQVLAVRGSSLARLARELGMARQGLETVLLGRRARVDEVLVRRVALHVGVDPQWLLGKVEQEGRAHVAAGEQLRALRARLGWQQDELAAHLGVSQATVSRWEFRTPVPEKYQRALHELAQSVPD